MVHRNLSRSGFCFYHEMFTNNRAAASNLYSRKIPKGDATSSGGRESGSRQKTLIDIKGVKLKYTLKARGSLRVEKSGTGNCSWLRRAKEIPVKVLPQNAWPPSLHRLPQVQGRLRKTSIPTRSGGGEVQDVLQEKIQWEQAPGQNSSDLWGGLWNLLRRLILNSGQMRWVRPNAHQRHERSSEKEVHSGACGWIQYV